jgi:hypothetical protein
MKKLLWFGICMVAAILLLAIPVSGTVVVLQCGDTLNQNPGWVLRGTAVTGFDGSTSGIFWNQLTAVNRQMEPIGGATIVNLGVVDFDTITVNELAALSYSTTPIDGNDDATNQLVNGDVFAVRTSDGNLVKVKVLDYGYDIELQWVTYKWGAACQPVNPVPEFPSAFLPVTLIIGLLGTILVIRKINEN